MVHIQSGPDRRESVPASATGCAATAAAAAAIARWGPPVLDSRLSVGAPMAPVPPRGSTRDRARLASQGMDGLLALAVPARNARRAAPYRGRAARPHPEDGHGESPLGATPRPGGARAVEVHGVGADRCQVHAQVLPRRPFAQLAGVPDGPCPGDLGVRLLLCSHDMFPDAVCLLRDAPRDSTDPPGSGDPTSHRRMGGPAGRGRVWLGSGPAAVSDP